MNPNTMVGPAPQRLVHDVAPPRVASAVQAVPISMPQPAPVPSSPQPTMNMPNPPVPSQPPSVEPVVAEATAVQSMPPAQPMFPVKVTSAPLAPAVAQPAAQIPAAPTEHSKQVPQAEHHPRSKTNWLVISLAILVTAGLALAAYTALKTSS